MKMIKKYMFLLVVLIFGSTNMAQKPESMSILVTENLVESLKHEIEGVVEASIYNTIFLEEYYPEADIERVVGELKRLSVDSVNPTIRYKAQLALIYLTNYKSKQLRLENYKQDQSELFREISEILKSNLLVSK